MKIGEVVERLRAEFPALSISKVRYLESEGLLHPYRVGNGYRRYSQADVERLRFTLCAQRDEYLPLSVIRQRLAELDASPAPARPRVVAVEGRLVEPGRLDAQGLIEVTGATAEQLDELMATGLVAADVHGVFPSGAQRVVELALAAHRSGVPLRNLRSVRSAAERAADSVDQALAPRRRRDPGAAREESAALARALGDLYAVLLQRAVEALD